MTTWSINRLNRTAGVLVLCISLFACASYSPRPLPSRQIWNDRAHLRVNARHIALPVLAPQTIDLNAPLTAQGIAALAVLNDPRLQAVRDQSGAAQAQAFAAGLLPDPTFSASRDIPQGHNNGVTSTAYMLRLQFDLGRLITRGAAVSAARAHLKQVDLQILWQEWQTAAAAEADYVALAGLVKRDLVLHEQLSATAQRLRRDREAQAAGIEPRTSADADLVDLQALHRLLGADARQHVAVLASLDVLLSLRPGTALRLAGLPPFEPAAVAEAANNVDRLGAIRPDLLALRAGYASREQALREAVLSQFPSVGIGISRARDTSDVNTLGFGVSFNLPLLNGSRGAIAVQQATRKQLYDDYILRIKQSCAQVAKVLSDIRVLCRQREILQSALPALRAAAQAADASLRQGNMTLPRAQAQRRAWFEQRLALQANAQQLAQQTVALQLLTGSGVFKPAMRH